MRTDNWKIRIGRRDRVSLRAFTTLTSPISYNLIEILLFTTNIKENNYSSPKQGIWSVLRFYFFKFNSFFITIESHFYWCYKLQTPSSTLLKILARTLKRGRDSNSGLLAQTPTYYIILISLSQKGKVLDFSFLNNFMDYL